ncbi:MAG: hypothetical protein BWX70_03262 [Verrucomicrobia bacterium ADurb.Bin070]|nr:MAG: hypothetical protein BWX70_03262 [Verrucomicrobia bacterium ADurb.Bin070]
MMMSASDGISVETLSGLPPKRSTVSIVSVGVPLVTCRPLETCNVMPLSWAVPMAWVMAGPSVPRPRRMVQFAVSYTRQS